MGMFGYRGGERRYDRAGFLVLAKLEGDRGADHRLLPLERRRESAHPVLPGMDRAFAHYLRCDDDIFRKAFVRTKKEMQRVLHPKEPLVLDPADRGVRGLPQRAVRKNIATKIGR